MFRAEVDRRTKPGKGDTIPRQPGSLDPWRGIGAWSQPLPAKALADVGTEHLDHGGWSRAESTARPSRA